MTSLAELRDALTALGLSTSTGSLRGDERRVVLEQRLREARVKLGIAVEEAKEDQQVYNGEKGTSRTESDNDHGFRSMTLSELRSELEARGLSTQTPGLKGEARRHALIQRLENTGARRRSNTKVSPEWPEQTPLADLEPLKSSRSSTSSYSAVSEFLFFDSSRADSEKPEAEPHAVPNLRLPLTRSAIDLVPSTDKTFALAPLTLAPLERELLELRKQLHDLRADRSRLTSRRLCEAGFDTDLDALSSAMAQLETERQRLLRIAFAHELVTTSALSGQLVELIQQDAVALIEKRQANLRHQIECVKKAVALSRNNTDHETDAMEAKLENAIRQLEGQLRQLASRATSRSSIAPSSVSSSCVVDPEAHATPVLLRCRSVPSHMFHETWQELDDNQKQQLQQELQAHKSFHVRRNRVCVGSAPSSARSGGSTPHEVTRGGILAFTRYPPTLADKLGVKALFLEQSQRSNAEIRSVYELALTAEPRHAVTLGNYARFLHLRCNDHALAEHMYKKAVEADPLCVSNLASYAFFLWHTRHEYEQAEQLYTHVFEITLHDPVVLGDYASLLRKRASGDITQLQKAKQLLQHALECDGYNVTNRLRLLAVLEDLGETTPALQGFEQLILEVQAPSEKNQRDASETLVPRMARTTAHVYGNFANFLQRSGNLDRAKQMYELALRLWPEDTVLQRN